MSSVTSVEDDDTTSLDRALNLFNKRDDDSSQLSIKMKRGADPMASIDYVDNASQIKWRRATPPPSSSMQTVDEDGTASDLWRMHSLHNTLSNSENLEDTSNLKQTANVSQSQTESKRMLSPIPAPSATFTPLDRFQHLASAKLPRFSSFTKSNNAHFIHFRGTAPPICTFQTICSSRREYYRLLIPPVFAEQEVLSLCCRLKTKSMKRRPNKFRFSSDECRLEKRENPHYLGKMKVTKRRRHHFVHFTVTLPDETKMCCIKIIVQPNKSHFVSVSLLREDNVIENDTMMKGTIARFVEPCLNLRVQSSKRTVLNITNCVNCIEDELCDQLQKSKKIKNVQMFDIDYPLSIFMAFAVGAAINSRHLFLE